MELLKDMVYYSLSTNAILYVFYIWIASIALLPIIGYNFNKEND